METESSPTQIIVAIDGPAGAGKSTIARRLASALGFTYIDTGAMYRAVALWAARENANLDDPAAMEDYARRARIELTPSNGVLLNGEDISQPIRTSEIAQAASRISAIPGVRRAMVEQQRRLARTCSVVMEGRDIGTVVFPNAQVKIYLDASTGIRAERRVLELREKGLPADQDTIESEIRERDHRDRTRAEAPLVEAPGAIRVDSSGLGIDEVERLLLDIVRQRTSAQQGV